MPFIPRQSAEQIGGTGYGQRRYPTGGGRIFRHHPPLTDEEAEDGAWDSEADAAVTERFKDEGLTGGEAHLGRRKVYTSVACCAACQLTWERACFDNKFEPIWCPSCGWKEGQDV